MGSRAPVAVAPLVAALAVAVTVALGQGSAAGQADDPASPPFDPQGKLRERIEAELRRAAERQSWLAGASAREQRERSRTALADLGAAAARDALERELASFLERGELTSLVDPGDVTEYLDPRTALLGAGESGATSLAESALPLLAADEAGQRRPVDLSLVSQGDRFEVANPLVEASLPERAGTGLSLGGSGQVSIGIELAGADPSARAMRVGETSLLYPNAGTDRDLLVTTRPTGIELSTVIRSPAAAATDRFDLSLPEGAFLRELGDGSIALDSEDERLGRIAAPIAFDAQGQRVPVRMRAERDAFVLDTDFKNGDYAYPILVDPLVETYNYTAGAFSVTYWPHSKTSGSPFYACPGHDPSTCNWFGGRIAIYAPTGSYPAGATAAKKWTVPHGTSDPDATTAWISSVSFGNTYWLGNAAQTAAPLFFAGVFNPREQWYSAYYAAAGDQSFGGSTINLTPTGTPPGPIDDGQQVHFLLWDFTSSATSHTQSAMAYANTATITITDPEAPSIAVTSHGLPGTWIPGNTTYGLTITASDPGLGVKKQRLLAPSLQGQSVPGYSGTYQVTEEVRTCTGGRMSPCSQSFQKSYTYDTGPSKMPEGVNEAVVNAADPLSGGAGVYDGVHSSQTTFQVKIDRSEPVVNASGGLWEGNGGRGLHVEATDGSTASAATERSGVTEVELLIDGQRALVTQGGTNGEAIVQQSCPAGNCPLEADFVLDGSQYSVGSHQFALKTRDAVGHEDTEAWSGQVTAEPPTILPNNIYNDMTLTAAGSPYIGSTVSIHPGATVTVEPGVTVKTDHISVNGSLDANGTSADPVTFTSRQTNPNVWDGIALYNSSSSLDHVVVGDTAQQAILVGPGASPSITNSEIAENLGSGIKAGNESSPTIVGNNIHHNGGIGIDIFAGSPEISGNEITDNAGSPAQGGGINYEICPGVSGCPSISGEIKIHDNAVRRNGGAAGIRVATGFSGHVEGTTIGGNEVTDNAGKGLSYYAEAGWDNEIPPDIVTNTLEDNGQNGLWVAGALSESTTWAPAGYSVVVQGRVDIKDGVTLDVEPGFVFKAEAQSGINSFGDLRMIGEKANPITYTSVRDDSIGGDTNGDGVATSPAPGDWDQISLGRATSVLAGTGTFDHVNLSYGGKANGNPRPMIQINCDATGPGNICGTEPPTVRHSKFTDSHWAGIAVSGDEQGAEPIVSYNTFRRNPVSVSKSGSSELIAHYNDSGCRAGAGRCDSLNALDGPVDWIEDTEGDDCSGKQEGDASGEDEGKQKTKCNEGADPVVLATGGLVHSHTDLRLTNKTPRPLELERTYNSQDPIDSGFGPGWSHSGLVVVSEEESGDVIVVRGDGRGDTFTEDSGTYLPPDGIHDVLEREGDGTFKLTTQGGAVYDFDETNRLASYVDDHAQATSYAYGASGRLETITDPSGQALSFAYNPAGKIGVLSDSTGREVTYTYTPAGDLDTVTDPLGGVTDYDYDAQRRLESVTDPRGVTYLENVYDGLDRVIEQTDGEGNVWTLDYAEGQTEVTEPEGGTTTYEFDELRRTESETNQLGHETSYTYDDRGNVETMTRPGGAVWTYDYDPAGNLTLATDPMGGEHEMTYDGLNQLTSYTDPRGEAWTYTWTDRDLTLITDPASGETEITYNAAGQPLTVTDPNEHTTTYTYDGRGNRLTEADALNHTTSFGYNSRNYLTSMTEPAKAAETYARSALGDLLSLTTPEGHATSYEYDGNGALTEVTDPALEVWEIERDGMERPTAYVDPLDNRTEITYDGNLSPLTVTDRRDKTTTYAYDLANQLTTIERPEGGVWEFGYDARGNRDQVTDPRTNITTYEFDLNDRMTEANEPLSTTTAYGYDPAGNLTSITDPRSNETEFSYDELGRMSAIEQPLGKVTSFLHDPAGNLVSRITAENTVTYDYDDADRLSQIAEGSNVLRSYVYDDSDRLIEATDAQAKTLEIGYDDEDNVIALDDDRGQTVAREFDSRGNLVESVDGRGTVQYVWDELSQMDSLTDPQSEVIGFDYDPEGDLIATDLPNGVTTTNVYDGDGRMTETSSVDATSTVLQSFDYAYDPSGNRTSQTDRNSDTTTYSYDELNRLTEWDPPTGPTVSYGYDAAGNRTSAGGVTSTFNELNQLTGSSGGTSYDYDDAGRLIERDDGSQVTSYGWDALDQLVEVDDGSGSILYSHDALGRRSERSEGSTTESAHYGDLTDLAILDSDGASSILQSYIQGPGGLVEERAGAAPSFPLTDAHGDVTMLSDGSGGLASRQEFDPWGNQLSGPALQMGWLGRYQRRTDEATGDLQMGVRLYAPALGRFATEDVVLGHQGISQTLNRYAYVGGNPITRYDLSGRDFIEDAVNTAGAIISDPSQATSDAVDFWTRSDSPAAPVLGPLATAADMAVNSDRIDDYFKGCNAAQIAAGAGSFIGGGTALGVGAAHAGAAVGASSLETAAGLGHAAGTSLSLGAAAEFLGLHALATAC